MAPPEDPLKTLPTRRYGTGAAEHVDLVRLEYLLVEGTRVTLVDKEQRVGRRRAPAAVGLVEHDVLRRRVARGADPVRVVPGGERRGHGQRRLKEHAGRH